MVVDLDDGLAVGSASVDHAAEDVPARRPLVALDEGVRKAVAQRELGCYGAGMELREIATDVYARLTPDRGLGWSNPGLVNRAGGLVVDTVWDLRNVMGTFRGMYELRSHLAARRC